MVVGRQPAAERRQFHVGPPRLPVPDAHRGGGRLAKRRVDGRVELRRVRDRQRGLHRPPYVAETSRQRDGRRRSRLIFYCRDLMMDRNLLFITNEGGGHR